MTLHLACLACVVPVVYSYVIYPLLLQCLAGWKERKVKPLGAGAFSQSEFRYPTVSVVIAAYNEESVIEARVRNLLETAYPGPPIDILIASDGSSDKTVQIVEQFSDHAQVSLLAFEQNRGKSATLNAALATVKSEVIVFSDANTSFKPNAISILVETLWGQPDVLAACGQLLLVAPDGSTNVDNIYWRYENWIKKNEGVMGALLGANGAIYAMRKKDIVAIPDNTIVDDLTIPLLARSKAGGRIVYEDRAQAFEQVPATQSEEFSRRVRIGTGAFQALALLWRLLLPSNGFLAFAFLSHKVLRWLTPFVLIVLGVLLVIGHRDPVLQPVGFLAFLFVLASLGFRPKPGSAIFKVLLLTRMFIMMNTALLIGFYRWSTQRQSGSWSSTRR